MCGLVGLYARSTANDSHIRLLRNLLYVDQLRGEHATGVAKVDLAKNEVSIMKKAVSATDFLAMDDVQEFFAKDRARLWIGHNRWATMGKKDDDNNAHPFQADHITLVHNGTVDRWTLKDLEGHSDPACVVDSEMVARTIAKHGAVEAIKNKFSGAFALVWYDANERTLNFARNLHRPLWLCQLTDQTLVWASEKEFLDFFIKHHKFPLSYAKDGEPVMLKENIIVSYHFTEAGFLKDGKAVVTPVTFGKVADPNPITYPIYGGRRRDYDASDMFEDNWNNRGTTRVTTDRTAYNSFDNRVNGLLEKHNLRIKLGDTINFERISWKSNGVGIKFGELKGKWGTMDHEVVSYSVAQSVVDEGSWHQGRVTNAYTSIQGPLSRLVIVVADVAPVTREKKENAVAVVEEAGAKKATASVDDDPIVPRNDPKSRWALGSFPLKVDGGLTFQNARKFDAFVAEGCIICGNVPTRNNIYNPWIYVAVGHDKRHFRDAEFMCGRCVLKEEQDTQKILEKHE